MTERNHNSSPTGSNELPSASALLIMLGELKASTLANREAMLQRTDDMIRFLDQRFSDLKEEVFHRFLRVEAGQKEQHTATDTRLRQLEIAQGLSPKPKSMASAALAWLLKAMPLYKLTSLAIIAVVTAVMHAMPAEMHALLKPIVAPVLEALKANPK